MQVDFTLQTHLDRINERTDRWLMQFNINKWNVLSIGRGNRYAINNEALISSEYEKDLRVRVSFDINLIGRT